MTGQVVVVAKAPVAGRVKTRLCPPCSPEEAAAVAAAALADTLDAVVACGAARKLLVLDGQPGPWLPPGLAVRPQGTGPFDQRLARAWQHAAGPGVLIGMDTPQVTTEELDCLLAVMVTAGAGALLGHAHDGGWWVIGLPSPRHLDPTAVFEGVPMSTEVTGLAQERRLIALGLGVARAPDKRDIDTVADLAAVAVEAPGTRTARVARRLGLVTVAA